ncbi:uncharacterized protein LOC111263236 isoform X1 [Varroa jacobsoni]|uniref:uncharacterized protein LOC111263236 isoform X1 n=1 Tax=Varroa jacobsoni TaxID=62625 RepID=UPI000BF98627|nr:uncharacterized protein LOC111263236 isoform X1 [Varroa jacobsoni]
MSLKPRLFTKDARRASQNLAANLHFAVSKVCRSGPVRLTALKVDYDRFFKDKIATKSAEAIAAALKAIEKHVIVVKVYTQDGNREMTESLLGLRSASYAADMCNEDSPQVSKQRLLQVIRDQASNGIYIRDLEQRYTATYGTRPSYLPYKSIKELLHRTAEVELASSGKNLRVRIRQQTTTTVSGIPAPTPTSQKKQMLSRIPTSLNRSSLSTASSFSGSPTSQKLRRSRDIMSMSMFRPSARSFREELPCGMTRSVFVPSSSSTSSSSENSSARSSDSGSPSGSIDISMSMMVPERSSIATCSEKVYSQSKRDISTDTKNIMVAILTELPPEGITLKNLIDEFVMISGQAMPLDATVVDFLKQEFSDIVKIADDPEGLRVYKTNSPLFPRRTLADVYTRIALHSNRRPSDRVLKVLKDIYKKREPEPEESPHVASTVPIMPAKPIEPPADEAKKTILITSDSDGLGEGVQASDEKRTPQARPYQPSTTKSVRPISDVLADLKRQVSLSPIEYPGDFEKIVEGTAADNQDLLMEAMSSLNLCLKPLGGRMVLTTN